MTDDVQEYIDAMGQKLKESEAKVTQLQGATSSIFASNQDPNLIEYQLELDNILERIEHLLRGDILTVDSEGNMVYEEPKDDKLKPLNNYGVQFLMNTISFYLNRNTILSNYGEDRIKEILYDLGYELTDQIYFNAEKMGLDTEEKRRRYPIIVLQIVHTIESAYNRAYRGGERESLREARVVTESVNPQGQMYPGIRPQKGFSFLKPSTWVR